MEFAKTWIDVFAKSWDDPKSLTKSLQDAPGYLQNLNDSDKAYLLEEILVKNKGLFDFFDRMSEMSADEIKIFKDALAEAFEFFYFIIGIFKDYFEPYIKKSVGICCYFIDKCQFVDIQIAASRTFKNMAKNFKLPKDDVSKILKHFKDTRYFIAICTIAKYHPTALENLSTTSFDFCDLLFQQLFGFFQQECGEVNKNKSNIEIFFESFLDLITNLSHLFTENFETVYKLFKWLCNPAINQNQEIENRILTILTEHMDKFSKFIFHDYKMWHSLFREKCKVESDFFWIDALQIFYKYISIYLLNEFKPVIFKYFERYFITNLRIKSLSINEIGLCIYGLGQLSTVHTKYSPDLKQKIYQLVIGKTLPYFGHNNGANAVELLPYYLQTFAIVLTQMQKIFPQDIEYLVKLSILILKNFPELKKESQLYCEQSFEVTLKKIVELDKKYSNQYLNDLFNKGIILTCSSALYIDVHLYTELSGISVKPISYKDYVDIWIYIFSITYTEKRFSDEIFKKFMTVFFSLIDNFNLKTTNNKADDEAHFRCFLNLVDLSTEIFDKINFKLLENYSIEVILVYLIKSSYHLPMISGFYKLIKAIFKNLNIDYHYEDSVSKCGLELISKFLLDVVQLIPEYSGELQLSCIGLIFNAPIFFVKDIVSDTIPILALALRIDLKNIKLILMTLEVIQTWYTFFPNQSLIDFRENLIIYLEPHLTNNFYAVDENLQTLRKKILLLLGESKYSKVKNLIYKNSLKIDTKWGKRHPISYKFIFAGDSIKLQFEKLIATTLKLTKSESRRVKFSACELLHTFIMIILGNDYLRKNQTLHCLNKSLCLAILRLSCDIDDGIRNLFHPLMIQLMHYLSSKSLLYNAVSQQFIDLLFEGMLDESNLCMPAYCGICLQEFVKSIDSLEATKNTTFMNSLIYKIQNYALHPSNQKKIAAAIAFNCLFGVPSSANSSLINIYWLQFLYIFVKSLEKNSHPQITLAIDNIVNTVKIKTYIFNGKSKGKRKVPAEFTGETLKSAVVWLLDQCGSENIKYRYKCMDLFENLCVLVPEYKSVHEFFRVTGFGSINNISLKDLDNCEKITIRNSKAFFKSMDIYIWLFNKRVLSPESVLIMQNESEHKNIFLIFYSKFLSMMTSQNVYDIINEATSTSIEADELKDLMNKIILKICRFIQSVLVSVQDKRPSLLLNNLWTDDLCKFVSVFTLCPSRIGLTAKALMNIEPKQMENWFETAVKKLPEKYLVKLKSKLLMLGDEFSNRFTIFEEIRENIFEFQYFVRGITILHKCKVYDYMGMLKFKDSMLKNKIDELFEMFTNIIDSNMYQEHILQMKNYVADVLNFLLVEYKPYLVKQLIKKIIDNPNFKSIEKLQTLIYQFLMKDPIETLKIIEEWLGNNFSLKDFFLVVEDLLRYAQSKKNPNKEMKIFSNELINNCKKYERLIGENLQLKDRLFEVYQIAVLLNGNEFTLVSADGVPSDFYNFILREFNNVQIFEVKLNIVDSFFAFMIDNSIHTNDELKIALRSLWSDDISSRIQKLENDELERSRATQCLRCLKRCFTQTGSFVLLETIVNFIAGVGKFFKHEGLNKTLLSYFMSLKSYEKTLLALGKIFSLFVNTSFDCYERLDILEYVLLPAVECTDVSIIGDFYEHYIRDIACSPLKKLDETNQHERIRTIITRIGYFRLTELALFKSEIDYILTDLDAYDEMTNFYAPTNVEEQELIRQLNCSILNCLIAMIRTPSECRPFATIKKIFQELEKNSWEKIVDCERSYTLLSLSKIHCKRFISIRPNIADEDSVEKEIIECRLNPYFSPVQIDSEYHWEGRQKIILQDDELNDHECMPMLTGLWLYLFNKKVINEPHSGDIEKKDEIWMDCLRTALIPKKDNLTLFVLRLLCNAKKAFLPFLKSLFLDIVRALNFYLRYNKINYLVRDVLVMFIELPLVPGPRKLEIQKELQILVESLIDRAVDEINELYMCNVALIESLVKIWSKQLVMFQNIEKIINTENDLAARVILIMFKNNVGCDELIKLNAMHRFVRDRFFGWRVPTIEIIYETLGFIMKFIPQKYRLSLNDDLTEILIDMKNILPYPPYKSGIDCSVRQLYLIFKILPGVIDNPNLKKFINPKIVCDDQRRVECIEMLLETFKNCDDKDVNFSDDLLLKDVMSILNERSLPCLDVAFETVETVINKSPAKFCIPFLLALEQYTKSNTLLRHRKAVYTIFINVYKKHVGNEESSSEEIQALNLSKKALINGIIDPHGDIQELILQFWNKNANLPNDLLDRLLHLLKLFDLDIASSYSQFVSCLLLELAHVPEYESQPMFSSSPHQDYPTIDYEVATPRLRLHSSKNRVPLYAPALARSLEHAIIVQNSDFKYINHSLQDSPEAGRILIEKLTRTNDFCRKSNKCSSEDNLSRQSFLEETNTNLISNEYNTAVRKEISNINNSIKVNRKYQISHVPNVDITQADVIVTLQDLALKNQNFAGELAATLICAVENHFVKTEMHANLIDSITKICRKSLSIPNDFAPVAMKILHVSGCKNFDAKRVAKISESMNLHYAGILLLERESLDGKPPVYNSKKLLNPKLKHNMHLLNIYQSIGEIDTVQSIMKNWVDSVNSDDLYEGYLAIKTGDWFQLKDIYEELAEDDPARDFCIKSTFRSLSELSNWNQLSNEVKNLVGVDDIWNHPRKDELLPWMFTGELQKILNELLKNEQPEAQFFDDVFIQLTEGNTDLLKLYGEELAVYHLCNDNSSVLASLQCFNSSLGHVLEQWLSSNPLVEHTKLRMLAKLGRMADLEVHLATMKSVNSRSDITAMLDFWRNNPPEPGVELSDWNSRLAGRLGVARALIKNINKDSMESGIETNLMEACIEEQLKISELALDYGNKKLLQKYTKEIQNVLYNFDNNFSELKQKFEYLASKYKFLCANEKNKPAKSNFRYYVQSWELASKVANNEDTDISLSIKAKQQTAIVVRAITVEMQRDSKYSQLVLSNDFILRTLQTNDPSMIEDKLKYYYLELLKSAYNEGSDKERGDNLITLANYCYQILTNSFHRSKDVQLEYTNAILTAMSYGSVKALRFFFDLLRYENYVDNDITDFFVEKCKSVPTSVFLLCKKEIIAHLDTDLHELRETLIVPIVERLANEFPSAIMYDFREMWTINTTLQNLEARYSDLQNPQILKKKEIHQKMKEELSRTDKIFKIHKKICDEKFKNLFEAMEYLCQPEVYMKFYLSQLVKNNKTAVTFAKALKRFIEKIQLAVDLKLAGSLFKEFLSDNYKPLEELMKKADSRDLAKNACNDLLNNMRLRLKNDKSLEPKLLESYSPLLTEFPFDKFEIEVPGLSNKSTQQQNKVFISRIDSNVEIITSGQYCSLIINIIGTNGKSYGFLVKFGTDLRRDETMQRLFRNVNDTLCSDLKCVERHLFLSTYNIIPISTNLSLVQFMDNVKSLQDFVELNIMDKSILETTKNKYQEWIEQSDSNDSNVKSSFLSHRQALLKYSSEEVELKLKELICDVDWDFLRRTFVKISSSIACFFMLRKNFVLSYSVMCTVDWIVGVGDRRLKNILIDTSSGKCFGAGYKMIFGTGVDQPIPELVPFRLTSQILGVLKPFTPRDLFGVTMSRVLEALRNEKIFILIYTNMVLFENLNWHQWVAKSWSENFHPCDDQNSFYLNDFSPKFKYEIVQRKLNGDKPSEILIEELGINRDQNDQYFSILKSILKGNEFNHNIRATLINCNLTPEEQMLCLIDQAMDYNILGRMSSEWCPFV